MDNRGLDSETEEHKTYCKVKLISGFGVGSSDEKEEYELAVEETLFSMVAALNKDTKNEKIVPRHEEHLYFCLDVYDVYRESFW